jgi:hypothetical protein
MCVQRKGEMGKWGKWREKGKLPVTTEKSFLWIYNQATLSLGPSFWEPGIWDSSGSVAWASTYTGTMVKFQIFICSKYFKYPMLTYKVTCCVRQSATVSLWPSVCDRQSWEPNIEVLKLRSWEPNAATRQQQKKRVAASNRTCMASKIRDDGGCGHCNTRFYG